MSATTPIKGYRELSQAEIDTANRVKEMEIEVGEMWRAITNGSLDVDRRWTAVAKTHFQEGFSALIRSITKPEDVY